MSNNLVGTKNNNVTMTDIARLAGVSRPTVSVVLSDRHEAIGIAAETRDRVLQAAKELGFRRNALARAIKTGRSLTLGFLSGGPEPEFSWQASNGVVEAAEAAEYTVKQFRLQNSQEDSRVIERCSEHRLDGIVVHGCTNPHTIDAIRREFEDQQVPLVWLDPQIPQNWGVQIRPDEEQGAVEAVRHLANLGHRRIAFAGGNPGMPLGGPRAIGFERGMAEAGLDASLVLETQSLPEHQAGLLDLLLDGPDAPTALVAACDDSALVFLRHLHSRGLHVPGDISVVGFGNLARVGLADPALSTVHVPFAEMGRRAVEEILNLVQEPERVGTFHEVLLPTAWVERSSTGPAPSPVTKTVAQLSTASGMVPPPDSVTKNDALRARIIRARAMLGSSFPASDMDLGPTDPISKPRRQKKDSP